MSSPSRPSPEDSDVQPRWWPPVLVLSIGWALAFSVLTSCASAINLAGASLSGNPNLDTLPLSATSFSTALFNFLLPSIFKRLGRHRGYVAGTFFGIAGGLCCMVAIELKLFSLLILGGVAIGISLSNAQNYRFGVILCVPEAQRSVAISWVLAGGVAGAVIGPEFSKHALNLLPARYSGIFLICSCVCGLHCLVLLLGKPTLHGLSGGPKPPAQASARTTRVPPTKPEAAKGDNSPLTPPATPPLTPPATLPATPPATPPPPARGLLVIFSQPRCAASTLIASLSYGVMVFLMSALPLAMSDSSIDFPSSSTSVQIHMVCMFAPSFVTGHLVRRLGAPVMQALGAALMAAGGAIMYGWSEVPGTGIGSYAGADSAALGPVGGGHFAAFTLSQAAIGIGWNWCFVAATSGLTELTHAPERPKAQAANDIAVFTTTGVVGVAAAAVYQAVGWVAMQMSTFGVGGAILAIVLLSEGLERARHLPRRAGLEVVEGPEHAEQESAETV